MPGSKSGSRTASNYKPSLLKKIKMKLQRLLQSQNLQFNKVKFCNTVSGETVVVPNCFQFVCESKGAFGCFLGMTQVLKDFLVTNINSYVMTYNNDIKMENDNIIKLLDYLQKENIYIKVFNSKYTYLVENVSIRKFIKFFGKDLVESHTTFASYENISGFYVNFNDTINIQLNGMKYDGFGMMLYKKFGTDLIKPQNTFNYKKLIDDIYPILLKLHKNNKYHGDIKEGNIVYNENSTTAIKYKLIDYDFSGNARTFVYRLPYLLFNSPHTEESNQFAKLYTSSSLMGYALTYPELNLFERSFDIINEFMSNFDNVSTLLTEFNIKENEYVNEYDTYLRIKSDDYALAIILFHSIRDKDNNFNPELLFSEYKDVYEVIIDLLSIKPYFLQKEKDQKKTDENLMAANYYNKKKNSNSFGGKLKQTANNKSKI